MEIAAHSHKPNYPVKHVVPHICWPHLPPEIAPNSQLPLDLAAPRTLHPTPPIDRDPSCIARVLLCMQSTPPAIWNGKKEGGPRRVTI
eukprot:3212117-Pyramimonas_sp.AAC.1